jgi:hypothetical protein
MSRWHILPALAVSMLASPVLAANTSAASGSGPAAKPAAVRPVLTAQAPFSTVWNSTLLSANSQAMGLQVSHGPNNHIRWTIAGAAIGAIVGAVAGNTLSDAAIGAAVGFGGSYVVHR